MADGYVIRPAVATDEPFIFKAWLEGYWEHFPGRVIVTRDEYMRRYHGVIERILADEQTRTVVAHVEGDADLLLGFACGDGATCFHWAYVKQAFRKQGIGSALLAASVTFAEVMDHFHPRARHEYDPTLLKEYTR